MGRCREHLIVSKSRKTAYLGHILRHDIYEKQKLLSLIIMGEIEEKQGLGRRQISWLKNVCDWTGLGTRTFQKSMKREKNVEID